MRFEPSRRERPYALPSARSGVPGRGTFDTIARSFTGRNHACSSVPPFPITPAPPASLCHGGLGPILHHVRHEQRQREEEQAQEEVPEGAVPLALRNAGGPEPPQDRGDDGDDAQAPPKHLKLPYPVMLCRFQHGDRGRRLLGLKVPICHRP
jgi:hypothetical protein